MKYLLLLCLFVLAEGGGQQGCNVVTVQNNNYEKQVLKSDVHNPYQLAIDYNTNTLFFSYSSEVNGKTVSKIAYINLITNEYGHVSGIKNGMANAVDSNTNTVYFGGKKGLYTYDYATKKATNLGITDSSIWQMFFCHVHGLYFTTYKPDEKSFVYKDGQIKPVIELEDTKARLIAIGEHHDIYFANSSGVFIYVKSKTAFYDLGDYNVNGFASNALGKLYFSTPNAIYFVNEEQRKMEPLISVTDDSIYGVTVDSNNNLIYALEDSIIRLVPTTKTC